MAFRRTHGAELRGATHARCAKPGSAMHRLRFSHEVDGDRAERYRPRPANVHLSAMQKGSATRHRKCRDGGLVGAEAIGKVMYQRQACIAQASICRERAQADPARHDYWIDEAIVWLQRAIEARRGIAVSCEIHDGA
jgi:hypothetical protein